MLTLTARFARAGEGSHTQCCASLARTWHRHGARLLRGVSYAQLPVNVEAPALDPAARLDRARVEIPQGDGGGGDAYGHGGHGCS